ncbi:ABC transporter ATP-binding protein [Clostridium sp. AM42-4]|uniref:ABC transporter ATP-binding protein n=1 Tax=Clostridium sp. AM42-4 TaxID=2292305 RepID=UPI000E4A1424|nr:ABC transporter ATP-binding protein [Clostridium sp. AM42-4]RHS87330.1 ABC transporter ATP-binding protein [Clostridium sp. AM42-4]
MSAILKVENLNVTLTQRKSSKKLVEEVSFEVRPGECLGILGESGSGKSMTVKSVLGLLDKNFQISGRAIFDGQDLLRESKEELRRLRGSRITMVLQNPMTCFDPLYRIGSQMAETFATHTTWSAQEIRSHSLEILAQMRIRNGEEVLEKYPHQLSGGMLQRIMIGIAMALEPELLIADEPTTAIDAITQYEILEEFVRIKKEKHTAMLFITHDLGAISKVADRVLVMNSGHIVDSGTFEHILMHANDPYTRMLVEKRSAVMHRYRQVLHGDPILSQNQTLNRSQVLNEKGLLNEKQFLDESQILNRKENAAC